MRLARRDAERALTRTTIALLILIPLVSAADAQTCVPAPDGLIGWWPGEDDARDAAGSNPGTLENGVSFAPGMVGQAFLFDGLDDMVTGSTTTGFPLGDSPRTITAWVRLTSIGPRDAVLFHYGVGNAAFPPTNFHLVVIADGRAAVGNGFGYGMAVGTTNLNDGGFHFLSGVYEGPPTNTARIYVDAIEEAAGVIIPPATLPGGFTIGQELPLAHTHPFHGLLDELDLYDRALSPAEIRELFDAGGAGKCRSLPDLRLEPRAANVRFAGAGSDRFTFSAEYVLGDDVPALLPDWEPVQLSFGAYAETIPSGSFSCTGGDCAYTSDGPGITKAMITDTYLSFVAEGLDLSGTGNPLIVVVAVGDVSGQVSVRLRGFLVLPRAVPSVPRP